MNLNAPTNVTFLISVVLVVLAVISTAAAIPFISANAFWVSVVGFIILALGNMLKGM